MSDIFSDTETRNICEKINTKFQSINMMGGELSIDTAAVKARLNLIKTKVEDPSGTYLETIKKMDNATKPDNTPTIVNNIEEAKNLKEEHEKKLKKDEESLNKKIEELKENIKNLANDMLPDNTIEDFKLKINEDFNYKPFIEGLKEIETKIDASKKIKLDEGVNNVLNVAENIKLAGGNLKKTLEKAEAFEKAKKELFNKLIGLVKRLEKIKKEYERVRKTKDTMEKIEELQEKIKNFNATIEKHIKQLIIKKTKLEDYKASLQEKNKILEENSLKKITKDVKSLEEIVKATEDAMSITELTTDQKIAIRDVIKERTPETKKEKRTPKEKAEYLVKFKTDKKLKDNLIRTFINKKLHPAKEKNQKKLKDLKEEIQKKEYDGKLTKYQFKFVDI